ncbi:MAG TPA: hypothetical protein VGE69_17235 [Pseudomonadales bacterium]
MSGGTVPVSSWRSLVKDELPNASNTIVDSKVREALRDFCKRGKAQVVRLDPMHVLANIAEYELFVPRETRLLGIVELKYRGKRLTKRELGDLEANDSIWESRTGHPTAFTMLSSQIVRLIGIPQERVDLAITGTVTVIPTQDAEEVSEDLFGDWGTEIAAGAKALLYGMRNTPWYDQQREQRKQVEFEDAIVKARSVAARGYMTGGVRRTQPHYF